MSTLPIHELDSANRRIHRNDEICSPFGYHQLSSHKHIPGFELYSSNGMIPDYGPARSTFYRFGLATSGSLHVQVGLEHYQMNTGSVMTTIPGQIHAKSNATPDIFGYYLFFKPDFLEPLLSSLQLGIEFPYLDYSGQQVFSVGIEYQKEIENLLQQINNELQNNNTGRETAIKMYLYLLLLAAKRGYEQQIQATVNTDPVSQLVSKFHKLVGHHFLHLRLVSDYANLLHVTPNHLNRVIKNATQKTASEAIDEMLIQEAKVLLKSTTLSAAEIAYKLDFSNPSSFSHFFKKVTGQTPLNYRNEMLIK